VRSAACACPYHRSTTVTRFAVVAALVASSSCIANPWAECNEEKLVVPGETVGGVDPALSVAPLLGSHPGTLTWSVAGRSTAFHLEIDRDAAAPIPAPLDCDNSVIGFDVDVTDRIRTDDGLVDETGAGFKVRIDPGGRQAHLVPLRYYVSFEKLRAAGVTPPAYSDSRVDIAFPISNLAPGNGSVRLMWSDPSPHTTVIGDLVFP
jgi:hypothetical protein